MDAVYNTEYPVLYFNPKSHTRYDNNTQEFILWPVHAYRVVAPKVHTGELNIFQRAILGLCYAGMTSAQEIGEKLSIHHQMVLFVMQELMQRDCLTQKCEPTKRGGDLLNSGILDIDEMVSGFVFQNPRNGELWPRFVERLNYCDVEYKDNGFPLLILGTTGTPTYRSAFRVTFPENAQELTPTPHDILRAVSSHQQYLRRFQKVQNTVWSDDTDGVAEFSMDSPYIKQVSFVDDNPIHAYLATYIYFTENLHDNDWFVCDPFVPGASVRLRRYIDKEMQTNRKLREKIDALKEKQLSNSNTEQIERNNHMKNLAHNRVESKLSPSIRIHPCFQYLVALEFCQQEAQTLEGYLLKLKLDSTLGQCRKALEALFAAIAQDFPLDVALPAVDRTKVDKALLSAKYEYAAKVAGFTRPLPKALTNTKGEHIHAVIVRKDHWRLRPAVMAALLASQHNPDHPLRKAATSAPKLLEVIDQLASDAGKGSHAGDTSLTLPEVEQAVNNLYWVVGNLTGLAPKASADRDTGDNNGQEERK